jgi:RHS repeat-associated protein
MPNRNMISENYRFGYQRQFAEKDEETGWNAFEARMWDARLGRWMAMDPAGQYASTYMGMGNNPVSGVDPDGMETQDIQTDFVDVNKILILHVEDGLNDIIVVPNNWLSHFLGDVGRHINFSEEYMANSFTPDWKAEILGFESTEELGRLDIQTSKFSRQKYIEYLQNKSLLNWTKYLAADIFSQNINPLKHLPASPIKIKISPLKFKAKNSWNAFRSKMGVGAFTKSKFGSAAAANAARKKAYLQYKIKNGYK